MKKVVIASKTPVKIQAVKNGFEKIFPGQDFEFVGVAVPSGVADQPFGNEETFCGAKNRVDNASNIIKDADFYVGIEGGIEQVENEMEVFAWVFIKSASKCGKAKSGTFFLPNKIVELLKEGKELSEADDIVFKRNNSKQKNGTVGILTGNIIGRTKYYADTVILAMIPFKNVDLY